jgi:hypothetical protein
MQWQSDVKIHHASSTCVQHGSNKATTLGSLLMPMHIDLEHHEDDVDQGST